ncbi:MAG: hypothetical protein RR314_04650 [Oscillospiraceae bacterium]
MKLYVKGALLAALSLGAAVSAYKAVGGIREREVEEKRPVYTYEWSCDPDEAAFVLREYDGHVGVFDSNAAKSPVTVTDIELDCLRRADRDMLTAGIAVADRAELLTLLEDLGS